jgi:hypothetical protein
MADMIANLTLDLSPLLPNWNAAKTALVDAPKLVTDTQRAVADATFTATVSATPGTILFTTNAATLRSAAAALRAKLGEACTSLDALLVQIDAGLPVTVRGVS